MFKSSISRRMVVKAAACLALAATSLTALPAFAETTLERAK
ncbi:MAG: ectoine/hydroxyectoine ABC transporter substrate-binding protein EhuB, partial [Mesorhizobium sp.]